MTGRNEVGGGGAGGGFGEEEDGEEEVHPRGCRWEGEVFVHCCDSVAGLDGGWVDE